MITCPYCHQKTEESKKSFIISNKRQNIFEDILDGGVDGVNAKDLVKKHLPNTRANDDVSLRVAVHAINAAIQPMHIERKNGRYRIKPIETK